MKIKNLAFLAFLSFFLLSSASFALTPGLPHQFFGTVSINGAPAHDGTIVSARINGAEAKNIPSVNGNYGLSPNIFYVDDLNHNLEGSLISFFVNGVDSGARAYFANGKSTELNLAITVAVPPAQSSGGGGGGGGGGTTISENKSVKVTANATLPITSDRISSSGACEERWLCTEWSECTDGTQERTCKDANKCGTVEDVPQITQPCAGENEYSAAQTVEKSNAISGLVTSIASPAGAGMIALILIAAYVVLGSRKSRPRNWKYNYGA